ncbi:MAG TPA: PDZ domain-containing protein [Gemmatimonadaceae bacterium]|nr:PDZ domain-containing protein [Gemmatimonadaceae bacterium]
MRTIVSLLAGAAALTAGTLAAQTPAPRPETRGTRPADQDCETVDGRLECRRTLRAFGVDSALMNRAALGIQLGSTGSARDTLGVFVTHVTPKGPAENAGIFEGDRIATINGVDLRLSSADAGDSYAAGLPARRLTREVHRLKPGAVATLRVNSGGRVRDVRVTTGRASDLMRNNRMFGFDFDGPGNAYMFREGGPMGRFELDNGRMFRLESMPRVGVEGNPRMRLEGLPKIRMEGGPDIRLDRLPRVRMQDLPRIRLRDGSRVRVLSPSRIREGVRLLAPGDERILDGEDIIIDADGGLIDIGPSKWKSEEDAAKSKTAAPSKKKK